MSVPASPSARGPVAKWNSLPLYLRILIAMILGLLTGVVLGERAEVLEIPAKVILQLLGALAPPLILIAVVHVLMTSEITGKSAGRLVFLLILNTVVAILIGLTVANVLQPGRWYPMEIDTASKESKTSTIHQVAMQVAANIPKSFFGPLGDTPNIIGVIIIAIAMGIALRSLRSRSIATVRDLVEVVYELLLKILHWIIQLVPIGVFGIVAQTIGMKGFGPLISMGGFIISVILALCLQTVWYLIRIKYFSWPPPLKVLRDMRDALLMAFSTGSSTATMPVTYSSLKDKVGLRENSASMGALVGANFNNDGTALYEAMSALFIAQLIGYDLTIGHQLMIVLMSIVASVGAAGIPEAGIVTMYMVFRSVGLPTEYVVFLLPVDWFLDRCRTMVNVMGDVNVSCMLDGRTPASPITENSSSPDQFSSSASPVPENA